MTTLDRWLNHAVRRLSKDSADLVRREIQEHDDGAREAALSNGIDQQRPDVMAVQALGDPCVANRQYRKVLLTGSEAAVLRQVDAESRMICSNGWMKWMVLSTPGTLLLLSTIFLAMHQLDLARGVLVVGVLLAVFFTAPFFPIYTPTRGRLFRTIKWVIMIGSITVLFGPDSRIWSWLFSCCFLRGS
jgi:hypothetical protein